MFSFVSGLANHCRWFFVKRANDKAKKYIERKIDQKDKRNVIVHLTESSKPFLKVVNDNHIKLHEEILQKLPADKREFILESMQELIKALKTWSDNSKKK